ncbi:MAG: hypothetical protein ACRDK3_07115 [Actinomycetota bacterium]
MKPIDTSFTKLQTAILSGAPSADLADVAITPSGDAYFMDSRTKSVSQFSPAGEQIRRFGGAGGRPGQFTIPWRLTVDPSGTVYVLDIKQSRVHAFHDGVFTKAIAFAPTGITAQDVMVTESGIVYVGGYRHSTASDTAKNTVHRLADDGQVVSSFFPLDRKTETLNLRVIAGVSLARGPGDSVFAAQVTESQAVHFSADGAPLATVGRATAIYREPVRLPVLLHKVSREELKAFLSEWTQLVSVIPGPEARLILVYAVYNPVRYALDVYENGVLVAEGLGSECKPVAWLPDGRLVFSDVRGKDVALHSYEWAESVAHNR